MFQETNEQIQIRREQRAEGQRRIITNPTTPRNPAAQAKRPFVAKGHDAILKSIQDAADTDITVTLIGDGKGVTGKLVARDKFTITVLTPEGRRRTFYKHAIEGFEPVTRGQ